MSYDGHLITQAGGDGDVLDLEAIQARADAATEGPWETVRHDLSLYVQSKHANLQANLGYVGNRPEPDAEFIANARTDVPYLLALVREQQAQIERVQALADKLDRFGANTRAMNPTRHGGWEGKARDFERQAIAIRAALEARP